MTNGKKIRAEATLRPGREITSDFVLAFGLLICQGRVKKENI
jgi:hypothetical protein